MYPFRKCTISKNTILKPCKTHKIGETVCFYDGSLVDIPFAHQKEITEKLSDVHENNDALICFQKSNSVVNSEFGKQRFLESDQK